MTMCRPSDFPPYDQPEMGDQVDVQYLDTSQGGVGRASGRLSGALDRSGRLSEVVVETDGGATFIPRERVISIARA